LEANYFDASQVVGESLWWRLPAREHFRGASRSTLGATAGRALAPESPSRNCRFLLVR